MTEETIEEPKVWFTTENLFGKYDTEEEAQAAADKLNEVLAEPRKPYVRKVWTIEELDQDRTLGFTDEEKLEVVEALNESYNEPQNPTPAQVKYMADEHRGYFYFQDQNHSGCLHLTQKAVDKYKLELDEEQRIDYFEAEGYCDDINEGREDNPWVYNFYICQYWSIYTPEGIEIPQEEWDNLPPNLRPYEDEFIMEMHGLSPELLDDVENCDIIGWCDG